MIMKKTFLAPTMELIIAANSNIICASLTFAEGTTDVMYSAERLTDDSLFEL